MIPILESREGLVTTPGDGMHLSKRREEATNNIVRDLSWTVAQVDNATSGICTHQTDRVAAELDPGRHNAIILKTSLECDAEGSVLEGLNGREGSLVQGLQELRKNSGRANKIINFRRKERH